MPGKTFPIVAIGASAGGLEALKKFFAALPADPGMAFIVVTHRDPHGTTVLPEILSRVTKLPIAEPGDRTTVRRNHIYISPAAKYLKLSKGMLHFHHIVMQDGISLPIDFFFRSAAEDLQDQAICVILSGNGSDGTTGMMAIKGEGGMAMAEDLNSAQFSGMPAQAIATGHVDYVLPPEKMPDALMRYAATMAERTHVKGQPEMDAQAMSDILALVRKHNGSDFSQYKINTLRRRIERRMNVHHITDVKQYVRFLKENPHEVGLLFKELLIGVTGFFRDPQLWEALEKEILPDILRKKVDGDAVRIWVPGCSTGEEAYSYAILIQEYMEKSGKKFNVQIFATDLDDSAINVARNAVYSDGIALEVSPERLKKFFSHEDSHFKIRKPLREMVVFAIQNVIHDPPFTKLDLVSCRNLLIYLDSTLQKRIIPLFHYALSPGGIMVLGSSETVGSFGDLFTTVNSRWKVFTRREVPFVAHRTPTWNNIPRVEAPEHKAEVTPKMAKEKTNITDIAQKTLLAHHIPPSLIVNEKGDIYFIHGRTGLYLEPRAGQPGAHQNALDMAREGLQMPLTAVLRKAATTDEEVIQDGVRVRSNGHFTVVSLHARKIAEPEALRGLIWVSFTDGTEKHLPAEERQQPAPKGDHAAEELEFIKSNLRNTIEELETANEDLKSTNEELQSTNEELQSANEELETAKEEMQSLNEELHTVNAELETKVSELAHANDDMKNLLNSTGVATIFLDNQLHIKRFTSQSRKIMRLISSDVGRAISDIVSELDYADLVKDATEVLQSLVYKELEVRAHDWSWYLMRIMPYRTTENVIDGLVITFSDITRVKRSEILLAANIRALRMMSLENAPLEQVLDEILLTIERQSAGSWASISFVDKDGKRLVHGAAPSLPKAFDDVLNGIKIEADSPEPCSEAAAKGEITMMIDLSAQTPPTSFTALAAKHGIKAAWSLPIRNNGNDVIGVLTMYYNHVHKPSDIEIELVSQTISLMATAISRHKMGTKNGK